MLCVRVRVRVRVTRPQRTEGREGEVVLCVRCPLLGLDKDDS